MWDHGCSRELLVNAGRQLQAASGLFKHSMQTWRSAYDAAHANSALQPYTMQGKPQLRSPITLHDVGPKVGEQKKRRAFKGTGAIIPSRR
jgi:hypothetical protein